MQVVKDSDKSKLTSHWVLTLSSEEGMEKSYGEGMLIAHALYFNRKKVKEEK